MVRGTASVSKRHKSLKVLTDRLKALTKKEVYVGIPAEKSSRYGEGGVNNAELLYIHTHGSPVRHIPPRPVLQPAIEANRQAIGKQLAYAAQEALKGNVLRAEQGLERAGMVAQNVARGWFDNPDNGWAPNSPRTIAKKGSSHPLIDTGEMRKAITYVVRDK